MPKTTLRYNIQSWLLKKFAHIKVFKYPLFITYNPTTFKLKSDSYYAVRKLVKPGDILLRGYDSYLDGYCIPGLYSHAAIYVGWSPNGGSAENEHIIHAMTPCVQYTALVQFMRCDRVCVVRPTVNPKLRDLAVTKAISKLNVPYDYDFVFDTDNPNDKDRLFSCSELVYYCYNHVLKQLGWRLHEKNYICISKKMFTPDNCLPVEGSASEIVWQG